VLVRALDSDVGSRRGVRGKEVVPAEEDRQGEGGVWVGEGCRQSATGKGKEGCGKGNRRGVRGKEVVMLASCRMCIFKI
jgi:hypothetical protein